MRIGRKNRLVVCFVAVALVLVNPCYADSDYSGVDFSNPTPGYALMAAGGVGVLASLLAVFLTSDKGNSPDVSSVPSVPVTPVVAGKLSISLNQEPQDLHLGYRSVKIQNKGDSVVTISDLKVVVAESLINKIKYCSPGDIICRYKTESNCATNGALDVGDSCRIWFKAVNNDIDGDGLTTVYGDIGVQVTADSSVYSKSFSAAYEKALYVGGVFTKAGSGSASNLAKWNGSSWFSDFGGTDGKINALTVGSDGDLYIGGAFASAGEISALNIAKWNGASWSGIGGGTSGQVNAIAADANGNLYAGGIFTSAGGNSAANIAKWDGVSWSRMGNGTGYTVNGLTVCSDDYLYVAGGLSDCIDRWQISASLWSCNDSHKGVSDVLSSYGGNVYFGGHNEWGIDQRYLYVAKIDGSSVKDMFYKEVDKGSSFFALAAVADGVYVGGKVGKIEGVSVANIVKWNDLAKTFTSVGSGVDDTVRALVNVGSTLYAGGDFRYIVSGDFVSHIALWDGVSWTALGDGLNGSVYALTTLAAMKFLE